MCAKLLRYQQGGRNPVYGNPETRPPWWPEECIRWEDMVDLRGKPPYLPDQKTFSEVLKIAIRYDNLIQIPLCTYHDQRKSMELFLLRTCFFFQSCIQVLGAGPGDLLRSLRGHRAKRSRTQVPKIHGIPTTTMGSCVR